MHPHVFEAVIGIAVVLAVPAATLGLGGAPRPAGPSIETVEIAQSSLIFPLTGDFLIEGQPAAAPVERREVAAFRIMKRQVSLSDYARCVASDACRPSDAAAAQDVPATGVSFEDAVDYAHWISAETGESWRLPTALEAAAAAAERFAGLSSATRIGDPANPAALWLSRYLEQAAAARPSDAKPRAVGHFGRNSQGLEDFGGNVWEWTSTCQTRMAIDARSGRATLITENCGVRVLEGRHRAYMTDFLRDARGGGCAVGRPPDNLGFRLVREETPLLAQILRRLSR